MSNKYQKAVEAYAHLAERARKGDTAARDDKARAMQEVRNIERESANDGIILSRDIQGTRVTTGGTHTASKRSLQEEYVRGFDDQAEVKIGNVTDGERVTTMRKYHSKRLLGR